MKLPVKFRRSSHMIKLLVFLVVGSSVFILVSQRTQIKENEAKAQSLSRQVAQVRQENQDLRTDIEALGSDESVRKIARDMLGLVENGEVIFSDIGE